MLDTVGYGASATIYASIPSVANVCGAPNILQQKWGPFVLNSSGQSFTTGDTATYTGITYTNT